MYYNTIIKLLKIILVLFVLVNSCTEKYFPNIDSTAGLLVVDGRITNDQTQFEVNLYRSVEIESHDSLLFETGAQIITHCDDGTSILMSEMSPGKYINMNPSFKGEVGKTYWIEITTKNGKIFESNPEIMLSPISISNIYGEVDKIIIDKNESTNAVKFYFDLQNPANDSDFYLWEYQASFEWHTISNIPKSENPAYICYPEERSNRVHIYNASNLEVKSLKHLQAAFITEHEVKLNYEYYFQVHAFTISEECYKFWSNIKKVSQSNGTLFDVIPANVEGNIQCCNGDDQILGYFQVSSHTQNADSFKADNYNIKFSQETIKCRTSQISSLEYDPKKHHIIEVITLPKGEIAYKVKPNFCYDCSLKYSRTKPSFWVD
ncbi:hypothetical protein DF185_17845 [Marinifilum breve]|uniref:DUF4249 domain-containing protein n=1 Tax=Marinifilum breve TaxID=2184082 RepID=A0A2V3ZTU1_9BACT|nr:DUF4249 domain-containing protein [Marinifilum breve]PXX97831.1 hypothetical protein DF185_17845 [Marinifilum breve]